MSCSWERMSCRWDELQLRWVVAGMVAAWDELQLRRSVAGMRCSWDELQLGWVAARNELHVRYAGVVIGRSWGIGFSWNGCSCERVKLIMDEVRIMRRCFDRHSLSNFFIFFFWNFPSKNGSFCDVRSIEQYKTIGAVDFHSSIGLPFHLEFLRLI